MKIILLMLRNLLDKMSSVTREQWMLDNDRDSKLRLKRSKKRRWRCWETTKGTKHYFPKWLKKLRPMQLEKLKSLPCIYSINLRNNKRIFSLLNLRSRREKWLLEPNSQHYSPNQLKFLLHSRTIIKTTLRLGFNTLICLLSNPNTLMKSMSLDPIFPRQQHLLQDSN